MDSMRLYEVNDYIKSLRYVDRTARELERYSNYIYLQSNTKKELHPEDIMKLPWDEDEFKEKPHYSEEERKMLEERAAKLKKMIESGQMKMEKANLI